MEITADHLRFNVAEADALLNERQGLGLQAADVERLVERTEGWPAGLYLAALSLRGRDDAPAAVARFAGDDRHVVDYLTEEVLAGQPAEVVEFLLDTCILDRLCASLCNAVTGRDDAAAMLRRTDASNLFLCARSTTGASGIATTISSPTCCTLELRGRDPRPAHRRAAVWHMEQGLVSEAIRRTTSPPARSRRPRRPSPHTGSSLSRPAGTTPSTDGWPRSPSRPSAATPGWPSRAR